MAGSSLYELIKDSREKPIGPRNWLGNLRWFATEDEKPFSYTFKTIPPDFDEAQPSSANTKDPRGVRTLFNLTFENTGQVNNCTYYPDRTDIACQRVDFSLYFPFKQYGAILKISPNKQGLDSCIVFKNSLNLFLNIFFCSGIS